MDSKEDNKGSKDKVDAETIQKLEAAEAAEKAAKAGIVNRLFVKGLQKVGIVEKTKIDLNFENNIIKLLTYHKIVFLIVDHCEAVVQNDSNVLMNGKIEHPKDSNPWELIGGWLQYLRTHHYKGPKAETVEKYSFAFGRIGARERVSQQKVHCLLLRRMRTYTSVESAKLNDNYDVIKRVLHGMDDARHSLKNSNTTAEVKERGDTYRKMIVAYNLKSNEIQAFIDEILSVSRLHQMEVMKFAREMSHLSSSIQTMLSNARNKKTISHIAGVKKQKK